MSAYCMVKTIITEQFPIVCFKCFVRLFKLCTTDKVTEIKRLKSWKTPNADVTASSVLVLLILVLASRDF